LELVYLWVEEYKNIHNQGFNFSPKFNCNYDPDTNALTIDENDDYIENFFGDNINVTAIVGKNGSGKSSVLKLIYLIIYLYFHKNQTNTYWERDTSDGEQIIKKIYDLLFAYRSASAFLIVEDKGSYYKLDFQNLKNRLLNNGFQVAGREIIYNDFQIKNNGQVIIDYSGTVDIFSIYFNYSIDTLNDNIHDNWIEGLYHRKDDYTTPLLIEPAKYKEGIDFRLQKKLTNQRILLFYKNLKNGHLSSITTFFNPDYIKYNYSRSFALADAINILFQENKDLFGDRDTAEYASKQQPVIECLEENQFKILIKYLKWIMVDKNTQDLLGNINFDFLSQLCDSYKENRYKELNFIYLAFKLIEKKDSIEIEEVYLENIQNNIEDFEQLVEIMEDIIDRDLVKIDENDNTIKKISVAIQFHKNEHYETLRKYDSKSIVLDNLPENILTLFPAWLEIEVFEGNKSINSLSSGEKFKFNFIISLLYQLQNLKSKSYGSINLFLDEIEMGFHPEWQKSFLKDFIYVIKGYQKPINLYFLTHSPFLLSDIPKQNIIFLDTDEEGKCKVVDGLKEKKQTFGANIHTLLSDSFFMEDGLMGEFAKGKIDKAIALLNQEHLSDEDLKYCEQIISIIGEAIVKNQLQRMLDSKKISYLANDTKEEIAFLKHRIDLLSKRL